MATARKAAGADAKTSKKTPVKTVAPKKSAPARTPAITKPIKTTLSKTELNKHLAEASGVDAKAVMLGKV
jgi:hypothetical protein